MPTVASPPLPKTLELIAPLDIRAKQGSVPSFSLVAYSGGVMRVTSFFHPVVIDLEGAEFEKPRTPVILDHDTTKRIGHTIKQHIDHKGIFAEGKVSSASEHAQAFVADAKSGFPFQVSVGATVIESSFIREGESVTVNGKSFKGPLMVAKRSKIKELSVTVLGADSNTSAIVASANKNQKGLGMPKTNTLDIEAALATERQRINEVNFALKPPSHVGSWDGVHDEAETLRASAINGEVSLADLPYRVRQLAELQEIRRERPTLNMGAGPAIHSRSRRTDRADVLEAAVALHAGLANIDKHYDESTIEAGKQLGVTSLLDVCRLAAQYEGKSFVPSSKDSILAAAFSTNVIATLLSNVAGKSLEEAYNAFPSTARLVAKRLTANNFKEHTGIRVTGDVAFWKVGNQGQLKHGSLEDQSYTYKVDTYGRMFGLSRQSIIDDDLNALDDLPKILGRGAALAIEEVFWTLVLANTNSFFSVANANLISGAGSELGGDGLASAVQAFLEQVDPQGKPISVVPRFLCVPPALKAKADELFTSRTFNVGGGSTTASDRVTNTNSFFGLYEPVVSPFLGTKSSLTGSSDTHWMLFGEPRDVAAFGLAYLNGQEKPTVEQIDQPANVLGVAFRGYVDFGVCQIDHRGAVKSTGA